MLHIAPICVKKLRISQSRHSLHENYCWLRLIRSLLIWKVLAWDFTHMESICTHDFLTVPLTAQQLSQWFPHFRSLDHNQQRRPHSAAGEKGLSEWLDLGNHRNIANCCLSSPQRIWKTYKRIESHLKDLCDQCVSTHVHALLQQAKHSSRKGALETSDEFAMLWTICIWALLPEF